MMNKALAGFRDTGSFIAGILVGLSIVVPVIALTGPNPTAWQTFSVFGAPIILALGVALQASLQPGGRHHSNLQANARTPYVVL
jgi:energy-converting hydrogenase Eha subunit A